MGQFKSTVGPFSTTAGASKAPEASERLAALRETAEWRPRNHSTSVVGAAGAMTALIINPALVMEGGHSYSALLRVKAELSSLNVEHTCLASLAADAAVRELAAPVLPVKGLWWRHSYTHSEFLQHVATMRDHLSLAIADQKRLPDLLVLPCCDSVQVRAVAECYQQLSQIATPHLLIWLLFRPNQFKAMNDPTAVAQIDEYREAFDALKRTICNDRKITVVCETKALAAAYSSTIGLEVGIVPGPNVAGARGRELRRNVESRSTPRIVTLGHANMAKGYHLLPKAIKYVLDSDREATFFVHGTLENSDAVDGAAVFDALSRMRPAVITSNEVLTMSD